MPPKSPSPEENSLKHFFNLLGLTSDDAAIYQALVKSGPSTVLGIARKTGIPRTRVYRLLGNLQSQKIVDSIVDEHRTLAQAVSSSQLAALVKAKQDEVKQLESLFPDVEAYVGQQLHQRQSDTKVKYFKGVNGIQQMATNVLNAKNGCVGYTQTKFENCVGSPFAQSFYEEMFLNKIKMRDIISDNYLKSIGGAPNLGQEVLPQFKGFNETRYLPSDTLSIPHSMDVYNQVVAIYDWQGTEREIFGIEIHNEKVAKMQRQIFELLWQVATPDSELASINGTQSTSS